MSQQLQITGGAKVRDLQDVIIGTSGVLSSLAFNVANGVPKLDSNGKILVCLLYTSPSPRDRQKSRMPSSA